MLKNYQTEDWLVVAKDDMKPNINFSHVEIVTRQTTKKMKIKP